MIWLVLLACTGAQDTDDTGPSLPTGWFDENDIDTEVETCEGRVLTSTPDEDVDDWYWRDAATVYVDEPGDDYAVTVAAAGVDVPVDTTWDETGLALSVLPSAGHWEADTQYTVDFTDCSGAVSWSFATSELGLPLEADATDMTGRTFVIDLTEATWVEPGGFGSILALFFDTSILLGVQYADPNFVDLLGAQGYEDDFGEYHQYTSEPTWDFPIADFTDQPYFLAEADEVNISFSGVAVPVTGFSLSGTFSADGEWLGGGTISGLGDTREMGVLIEQEGDKAAMCDMAATLSTECQECPDGEPYCLYLEAVDIRAPYADVSLIAVESE